jgi:hypothetical protein
MKLLEGSFVLHIPQEDAARPDGDRVYILTALEKLGIEYARFSTVSGKSREGDPEILVHFTAQDANGQELIDIVRARIMLCN